MCVRVCLGCVSPQWTSTRNVSRWRLPATVTSRWTLSSTLTVSWNASLLLRLSLHFDFSRSVLFSLWFPSSRSRVKDEVIHCLCVCRWLSTFQGRSDRPGQHPQDTTTWRLPGYAQGGRVLMRRFVYEDILLNAFPDEFRFCVSASLKTCFYYHYILV